MSITEVIRVRKHRAPKVSDAVRAGAALLDEHRPGWDREIDLTRLSMASHYHCVVGQLYGEYYRGKIILGISKGKEYGFCGPNSGYPELDQEWRDLITARR